MGFAKTERSRQDQSCHHGSRHETHGKVQPATGDADYTCPMHPEIVRDEPGSCPICGMALDASTVTAVEEENTELIDMSRRFWVSLVFTIPVFVIAMA